MYRQTSLMAYKEAKTHLSTTQSQVLEALEEIAPATNLMIAKHLGWAINSVTPRMQELRKKQKVVTDHVGKDITGRSAHFWKPTPEAMEWDQ
jgi:predicted ArsR family transcriptional regulator